MVDVVVVVVAVVVAVVVVVVVAVVVVVVIMDRHNIVFVKPTDELGEEASGIDHDLTLAPEEVLDRVCAPSTKEAGASAVSIPKHARAPKCGEGISKDFKLDSSKVWGDFIRKISIIRMQNGDPRLGPIEIPPNELVQDMGVEVNLVPFPQKNFVNVSALGGPVVLNMNRGVERGRRTGLPENRSSVSKVVARRKNVSRNAHRRASGGRIGSKLLTIPSSKVGLSGQRGERDSPCVPDRG